MKNTLLLFILFTCLVSWGQDYDVYLNSFHSEDQSKTFQKFTYKIPEHVNSVQLNFDPRVVPDAFYVKYGDQEFWSGFVGDLYKTGSGLYKMASVPKNIKNRFYKDIYPSKYTQIGKTNIVDNFPRIFPAELVWYKQNDGLLESINAEITKVGGSPIQSIFKKGDGNAESITKKLKSVEKGLSTVWDTYGNVLKGDTKFTLKKESGEDEITIMVFSPLHGRLFDVVINTCETCQYTTKDISEIEFKDSKILLNGSTYDGLVTERYNQEQLKSVKRVKNGLITSEIIYHEDKNYKSNLSNFKNIEVITSKTEQLGIMDYQIDKLIKEGEIQLSQRDHLKENEMGDKFEKYQEKYNEGNLKGKKLELFNTYLKHKNNYEETTKKIKSDKKSRDEFKNSLFKEMKKPFYQPISKESFNYTNGQKTGVHKEYDKNEKLVLEEELKDGVRNGSYKRYENGEIEVEGTYLNNKKDGLWTLYYDGWKEEISYLNDVKNGDYKKYYGDVVVIEGQYSNGLKTGDWKDYNNQSVLTKDYIFIDDKLDGPYKEYSGDIVVKEGTYSNGLMTGEWIFRHDNGNLKGQGNYVNGDGENVGSSGIPKNGRDGEWILYKDNGNKSQIGSYVNGKEEGEFIIYHDNGNKNHVGSYRNGKRVGEHIYYHDNGNKSIKVEFREGTKEFVGNIQYQYDQNGLNEERYEFKNGEFKLYKSQEQIEQELKEVRKRRENIDNEMETRWNYELNCTWCSDSFRAMSGTMFSYGLDMECNRDLLNALRLTSVDVNNIYCKKFCSRKCAEEYCESKD